MRIFTKGIGPVFVKEIGDAKAFISKMKGLLSKASPDLKKEIEKQIKIADYGLMGEQNIAFELKHSGCDMYILHDICLEIGELSAQIDYIVITEKHVYILECKNLIGDIKIDSGGNFIRTYELAGKKITEGVYSPITQNERHINVIRQLRMETKGNFFTRKALERNFDHVYKSVVVLANPKTRLESESAKKEIQEKVIRADQLINYIKTMDAQSKNSAMSFKQMEALAEFFKTHDCQERSDYFLKYKKMADEIKHPAVEVKAKGIPVEPRSSINDELMKRLKDFRLKQSRAEGVKAYYIFNNAQLEDLVLKKPKTKEELLKVSGFGSVKVEKYGSEIVKIIQFFKK